MIFGVVVQGLVENTIFMHIELTPAYDIIDD